MTISQLSCHLNRQSPVLVSQRSGLKSWQVLHSLIAMIFSTLICNNNHNKYVIAKTSRAQKLRVGSDKQPKGKKKSQINKQNRGTKQIKKGLRKRKYSRSSRQRPPRKFETVAVTRCGRLRESAHVSDRMVKQQRVVDYESLRNFLIIRKERCS